MRLLKEIGKYIGLIGAIIVILLCYKLINNFSYLVSILNSIMSIVSPFIYAFVIAYLLNPIVKFLNIKLSIRNTLSILLTYTIIISLIAILSLYFTPKIIASFSDLYNSLPYALNQVENIIGNVGSNELLKENVFINTILSSDINSILQTIQETVAYVSNYVLKHTISAAILLGKWIIGFLISIYVLIYKKQVVNFFKKLTFLIFKDNYGNKLINFSKTLDSMIMLYIVVKGLTSLLIGLIAFVGLTFIGSPYAILISLFVTITNMIPYFGPFLGIIFALIVNIIFMPSKAIFVLIFLFLLQQFDGWYLYPKTVGKSVGLNPLVVIFSVILGGGLYGPIGMVLSVPIVASFMVYLNKYFNES